MSGKIGQLKLEAPDKKMRETDCANTETMFRIIQSIPSPKAEPFKRWLAKVGYERVQEIEDPDDHHAALKGPLDMKRPALPGDFMVNQRQRDSYTFIDGSSRMVR